SPPPQHHQGLGFGIKIGPLYTKIGGAHHSNGFIGGIWFGGNRAGAVGVMGEIQYARNTATGVALHYLEIPILIRINIGTTSRNGINFYILLGPVADVKLRSSDVNVNNSYAGLDLGILGGVGVE